MVQRLGSICFSLGCVLLALVLAVAGLLLPVRFETVHPSLLKVAGENTETVAEHAAVLVDFGKPGPARLLLTAAEQWESPAQAQWDKLQALEMSHPSYRMSGGLDPFFDQFLTMLNLADEWAAPDKIIPVNRLLSAKDYRNTLLGFLETSSNQAVSTILSTRELTGVRRFMPVSSAAGAPLDTAILTTALLIQSEHCQKTWVIQLVRTARDAMAGEGAAIERLEAVYMAVLGAAQRMNWLQLAAWVDAFATEEHFVQATAWLRNNSEQMALVYAICVVAEDAQAALTYRAMYGEVGEQDLQLALEQGIGALNFLLVEQLPIYHIPHWHRPLAPLQAKFAWLLRYAFEYPVVARGLMLVLFGCAGGLLSFGLRGIFSRGERIESVSVSGGLSRGLPGMMQHLGFGVLAVAIIVLLNEPTLLEQPLHEPGKLLLEFEMGSQANIIEEETMPNPTIDQVTIIVLLIFLFVQLVIYSLCLFKLAQIKRAQTTAELKIKLLDNEEVLFDMGLYVGLSGTVISLLMLAMGIVQASLVAAYASTLFGIIFVALLKVLHLRPLKRSYIMQAAQDEMRVNESAL